MGIYLSTDRNIITVRVGVVNVMMLHPFLVYLDMKETMLMTSYC